MKRARWMALALILLLAAGCTTGRIAQPPATTVPTATLAASAAVRLSPTPQPTFPARPTPTATQPAPTVLPSPQPTLPPLSKPQPVSGGPPLEAVVAGLKGLPPDAFFEQSYEQLLRRNPEGLTALGLSESLGLRNDRLNSLSDAYICETQALDVALLDLLRSSDRAALASEQQLAYDVYEWWLDDRVRGHEFMYHNYLVHHLLGSYDVELIRLFTEFQPLEDKQERRGPGSAPVPGGRSGWAVVGRPGAARAARGGPTGLAEAPCCLSSWARGCRSTSRARPRTSRPRA